MERRTRRKFSAEFKAKVAIEAIQERYSLEELARKYELHPNQIGIWKKEFLSNAARVFDTDTQKASKQEHEQQQKDLYAQIGQQKMEIEWLKKKLQ